MPIGLSSHHSFRFGAISLALALLTSLGAVAWHLGDREASPLSEANHHRTSGAFPQGPPWLYGHTQARFTLTLYADLECPFCKAYFPVLKSWVEDHADTMLEWSHLPLSIHEPTASELAVLTECVGEAGGQAAIWDATTWIYRHTQSDGRGLPEGLSYPGITHAVKACTASDRPKAIVRAQAQDAAIRSIDATPTVLLYDNQTGKTLLLPGPVDGDALLSALDLVVTRDIAKSAQQELPADLVGKPR